MKITVYIQCNNDDGDYVSHELVLNGENNALFKDLERGFDFEDANQKVQDDQAFIDLVLASAPELPSGYDNKCAIIGVGDDKVSMEDEEIQDLFWDYATSLN